MMTKTRLLILLVAMLSARAIAGDHISYVDPFIGTGGHGHTFPGATVPFGMVQLSPDTRIEGWDACGGYYYADTTLLGFSHTHLSGTGIADYGDILFLPVDGSIFVHGTGARFSHARESASPGYYRVLLDDGKINVELTATKRVGLHRYTFSDSGLPAIIVNLQHGLGPDHVITSNLKVVGDREITGMRRSTGWAKDQVLYFAAEFSVPLGNYALTGNDTVEFDHGYAAGTDVRCHLHFDLKKNRQVIVKVGLSTVSVDGARKNIQIEAPGWDFDAVRKSAARAWETELGKIDVSGGTVDQMKTFYTALYHAMIAPNVMSDIDGTYRGMDGKTHTASGFEMYTVFSLWDTFRAEHPLLTIIDQRRTRDFVMSLLKKQEESGVLPVWELASNETWTMIGYHAVPVIVDAYMKGIAGFDADRALAAMTHSAELNHFGLSEYRRSGFIGGDIEGESVSRTLEYAYDDWCIAAMAGALRNEPVRAEFGRRSQSYQNLFEPSGGFFHPKINGSWITPFDPSAVTIHFTEANPWQYNFFVPQDIDGLIAMLGGKNRFIGKLDSLFYGGSQLNGRQQSDITGLIGQYAQGNEPSHHVAYLYNYAGAPWKTQSIVRRIMDSLYAARPDGLCGNDDCGQMSAWYVMSAMGLYQVCPGQPQYAFGSPLFKKCVLRLENGKEFVIRADENSAANRFITSASLNGTAYGKSYISHNTIMDGGTLRFVMGDSPNPEWGSGDEGSPHSPPASPIVSVPYFVAASATFSDSTRVGIMHPDPSATIYYRLEPPPEGRQTATRYSSPILVTATSSVAAWSVKEGGGSSDTVVAHFVRHIPVGTISLTSRYDQQYTGGGDSALIDGVRGGPNFHLGSWQGYHGVDLSAVVDLGREKPLTGVALGCLQDNNSWIFYPTKIVFSFSLDGKRWSDSAVVVNDISPREPEPSVHDYFASVNNVKARYVSVRASSVGTCPPWHKGAGEPAWLFVDEILVNVRSNPAK